MRRRPPGVAPWSRTLVAVALSGVFSSGVAQTAYGTAGAEAAGGSQATPGSSASAPSSGGPRGWRSELSVGAQATLTNNSNYGNFGSDQDGDLILQLTPSWRFTREGARLRVDGDVALDMIGYANNTQVSRILPRANVLANLEAIENFFFVDGAINVTQNLENVFLPASQGPSTNNLYTSTQVRVAPYFQGRIGQNIRWLLRSDNSYTWTTQSEASLENAYYARNLAEIVRDPTPLGLTLQVTNDVTRIQNQLQPDQTLNVARAILDYVVTPQVRFGLRGGYETTTYTAVEESGPIYGANLSWKPSPLTLLDGYYEHRFYGPSYQYQFSHRHRRVATSISGYRTVSTYPQLLFQIPATNSVAGLLNAIFVARFPDPIERSQQVQDLITRQGLPSSLPSSAYVYNQSANVLTGANASWALIGVRNTLGLNIFYLKTAYLPDARVPPTFLDFNNSIQQGGAVTLSHRLTPVVSLNGTVTTSRTKGFDQNESLGTRQSSASVQASWQVSPRTSAFVGMRYQVQSDASPALAGTESNETAIFTGLFHRL